MSAGRNVLSLGAFSPLSRNVLDALTFGQRLEAGAVDVRVMDEQVLTAIVGDDESVTLLIVEPLHCTLCHDVLLGLGSP